MPLFKKHHKEHETTPPETTQDTLIAENTQAEARGLSSKTREPVTSGNMPITENYPDFGSLNYPADRNLPGIGYGTKGAGTIGTEGYPSRVMEQPHSAVDARMQQTAIPPSGALRNQNQTSSDVPSRIFGKMETAAGTVTGNESLKAKGMQKEREASAIKFQRQEGAEAERLERQTANRRDREVIHGEHETTFAKP